MSGKQPIIYKVKLQDGTIADIPIDPALPTDKLAGVIEGAIRARNRIKAGFASQPGLPGPLKPGEQAGAGTLPSSVGEFMGKVGRGIVKPLQSAAENFGEGVDIINNDPATAVSVLPEAIEGPVRHTLEMGRKATANVPDKYKNMVPGPLGQIIGPIMAAAQEARHSNFDRAANMVDAVPIVGPMATGAGEAMAKDPVEGGSELASNVFMNYLAAKGGSAALARARGAAIGPEVAASMEARNAATPVVTKDATFNPRLRVRDPATGRMTKDLAPTATGTTNTLDFSTSATPPDMKLAAEDLRRQISASRPGPPSSAASEGNPMGWKPAQPDNLRIRLPLRMQGTATPIYAEIPGSGAAMNAIKSFLNTVKGSAAETFWLQRVLQLAVPENSQQQQ